MRRAQAALDFSIAGDDHERSRIQLENNLQNTDLSLHLSSAHDDDYSIEFPRHNSGPQPSFSAFRSIDPSQDDFDPEEGISHIHAWSYRTGDDDEGITPYIGGETLSTAAHHASALTLSAGLGGRGTRRDASMSGAEYDPERPLQDLVANVNSKLSMLDVDNSRSRHQSVPFDPSVSSVDRILSSRHAQAAAAHLRSPPSTSSSSSSELDTPPATSPRPTLAATLNHLTFSPKRPRSPAHGRGAASTLVHSHSRTSHSSHRQTSSNERRPPSRQQPSAQDDATTPRPRKTRHQQKDHRALASPQPEINIRPPTPSTGSSKFTKFARDLAREIEYEQSVWHAKGAATGIDESFVPAHSTLKSARNGTKLNGYVDKSGRHLDLPDVTGLTAAIESPAKAGMQYYPYRESGKHDIAGKERLIDMVGLVQKRLAQLEGENNSSRRRMRELERELDLCKAQVALERERMMKREVALTREKDEMRRHVDAVRQSRKDVRVVNDESHRRYKEAVEEKKALESLVTTLRSHMSRLTGELSSHQSMLDELRGMREADANTMYEKVMEVDKLRKEVEKIAGEVEVLKGVVEDGLRERRVRHERSASLELAQEQDLEPSDEEGSEEEAVEERGAREEGDRDEYDYGRVPNESLYASREVIPPQPRDRSSSPLGSSSIHPTTQPERTTSNPSRLDNAAPRPFIDQSEIDHIAEELEERRSVSRLSSSQHSRSSAHSHSRPPSVASSVSASERGGSRSNSRLAALQEEPSVLQRSRSVTPAPSSPNEGDQLRPPSPPAAQIRPPSRLARQKANQKKPAARVPDATPFPQIRGERLERLFFSAPEHNAKTCTVCRRRRRPGAALTDGMDQPIWYASRAAKTHRRATRTGEEDEDEGFEDGSEDEQRPQAGPSRQRTSPDDPNSPNLDFLKPGTPADRLPPQTVLAKVLRELEDDFTHYKGIYLELAQQYGLMDPVSNVVKRNVLAEHLREVIDILEQRGDQIASLYDLLSFEDKPMPSNPASKPNPSSSIFGAGRTTSSKKRTTFA